MNLPALNHMELSRKISLELAIGRAIANLVLKNAEVKKESVEILVKIQKIKDAMES